APAGDAAAPDPRDGRRDPPGGAVEPASHAGAERALPDGRAVRHPEVAVVPLRPVGQRADAAAAGGLLPGGDPAGEAAAPGDGGDVRLRCRAVADLEGPERDRDGRLRRAEPLSARP